MIEISKKLPKWIVRLKAAWYLLRGRGVISGFKIIVTDEGFELTPFCQKPYSFILDAHISNGKRHACFGLSQDYLDSQYDSEIDDGVWCERRKWGEK